MEKLSYDTYCREVLERLTKGGIFLTSGKEKPNSMTIGWGSIGCYWGKPIFIVPVRKSRYTHGLIEECSEFTVSVPLEGMKEALAFCGTKSGRDVDKFKALNLTPVPGQTVQVPIIGECDLHFECRVVYKQDMDGSLLIPESQQRWYGDHDYHTMYYGEILACYRTK